MIGEFHPASKPKAYTWVLLHGLGSNRAEWVALSKAMAKEGQGILIYDARGHGDSVRTSRGETLDYKTWRTAGPGSPWNSMISDLEETVTMLEKTQKLLPKRIAVGGASLGANVALVYASRHPDVPALLLLSPGIEYAGINTSQAWTTYVPRKVLLAASPEDAYAYQTVQQYCAHSTYSVCPKVDGKGAAHGVNMLDANMTQQVLNWMKGLTS